RCERPQSRPRPTHPTRRTADPTVQLEGGNCPVCGELRGVRRLAGLLAVVVLVVAAPVGVTRAAPAGTSTSPFSVRGVIEGFYGPVWTHAARLAALAWMGGHGMNTYAHAPKGDPWQRANWRDPYPASELGDYVDEIGAATAAGVAWVPNLSPGLPLIPGQPAPGVAP